MKRVRLSAILCNFNHGAYVGDALQSILGQTRRPDEIIVVDDGSTDHSMDIIGPIIEANPWIRLISHPHNLGIFKAALGGTLVATGDYLTYPSADDKILPTFYEKALEILEQYPQAALVTGASCDLYSDRKEMPGYQDATLKAIPQATYVSPEQTRVMERAYLPLGLAGYGSMFRAQPLRQLLPLPEATGHLVDWFYMRVLAFRHGYCFLPELAVERRVLHQSMSSQAGRSWPAQRRAIEGVMEALQTPLYRDVLADFVATGSLAVGGYRSVGYILSRPRYWKFLTPLLIFKGLVNLQSAILPRSFTRLVRNLQTAIFRWPGQ